MSDTTTQNPSLAPGEEPVALQSGDDLARAALEAADDPILPSRVSSYGDVDAEVAASDQLAETLTHLQSVIERNVSELKRMKDEIKLKRESLQSVFENDTELGEAEVQAEAVTKQVKERKAQLQANPQAVSLKAQIAEMSQEKKEVEEALNNHLLNYYSLTNSMSIDTSDGDQLEFKVRASIKSA
jgi:chromosome segregation ATPase